jgi:hypothetical protein
MCGPFATVRETLAQDPAYRSTCLPGRSVPLTASWRSMRPWFYFRQVTDVSFCKLQHYLLCNEHRTLR